MSTANKNYPLINETDSEGDPLNAYDQLVTESNNFRRAVDNDINEVDNKVSSLEQDVSVAHENITAINGDNVNVDDNISTIFENMNDNSKVTVYGYPSNTGKGHPVTEPYAYYVANITKINNNYGQCVFTTRSNSFIGGWQNALKVFNWRKAQ